MRDRITRDYWMFTSAYRIPDGGAVASLLAYAQYLKELGLSFRTIRNYMSALKTNLARLGAPISNFDHQVYKTYMQALARHKPTRIITKGVFTVPQLHVFFGINSTLPHHSEYALAFSLTLFAYLRISNLVPPKQHAFDINKQLMSDVWVESDGLEIHLKWA